MRPHLLDAVREKEVEGRFGRVGMKRVGVSVCVFISLVAFRIGLWGRNLMSLSTLSYLLQEEYSSGCR
jgi:hypothetical protein